jgi:hypothetical protein
MSIITQDSYFPSKSFSTVLIVGKGARHTDLINLFPIFHFYMKWGMDVKNSTEPFLLFALTPHLLFSFVDEVASPLAHWIDYASL